MNLGGLGCLEFESMFRANDILENYEYARYCCDSVAEVKLKLKKYGVAVLPHVLDKTEVESLRNGMWDYLEHITGDFERPIKRDDPSTWRELRHLYPLHAMLVQQWSVGHAQFLWDLRQNPKVASVFAEIWSVPVTDLLTSFDGASFHMPPETTGLGWHRGNTWLHADQSYLRSGFECVQSWITAYDVQRGDATLTVLEGSHALHDRFRDRFEIQEKSDWNLLANQEQHDFYVVEHGCQQKFIQCPAGSMVFWDSRTIHSGQVALRERAAPNFRFVAYICMTPRNMATPKMLEKKRKAFDDLRSTNHYPHKIKLFPLKPHTRGKPLQPVRAVSPPEVNELGRRLAGFV